MLDFDCVTDALHNSGLRRGMTVFSHSNIGFFGQIIDIGSIDELVKFMLRCFSEVLGPEGTLILPAFTYSFGNDKEVKLFDVERSQTKTSALSNWLIRHKKGYRSTDPMLSVVAIGAKAKLLTSGVGNICFGSESIWARLYDNNALICNLNLDSGSTYLHWVERQLGVPYRSDIAMSGHTINGNSIQYHDVIYTGRDLTDSLSYPRFEKYHFYSKKYGLSKVVQLGRGQIVTQYAREAHDFLKDIMNDHPYILTARGAS